jgi:hypothetical protein
MKATRLRFESEIKPSRLSGVKDALTNFDTPERRGPSRMGIDSEKDLHWEGLIPTQQAPR